jgi:hypothetical protein
VPKGEKILFTKIKLKGGEAQRGRKILFTKIYSKRGENDKRSGSTKIFEHTSRGSNLLNMIVAFPCALHMYDA